MKDRVEMIIDFSVSNFRSFKSEQVLSMYADKKLKHHAGNLSCTNDGFHILKTSAIYGSNASGKSNVINAFEALKRMIVDSGDWKDGDPIPCYEPYLLSNETKIKPSRFEIEFYLHDIRYLYEIEFNKHEITFERLVAYYSSKPSNLFTRESPDDWKSVNFGDSYKGGRKSIAFFSNNSYLSKAGNTPDAPDVVRNIYNYFRGLTHTIMVNNRMGVSGWSDNKGYVAVLNTFLRKIDLGINKFDLVPNDKVKDIIFPDNIPAEIKEKVLHDFSMIENFYHEAEDGSLISFNKNLESLGTKKLFDTLPFYLQVLETGAVVFVDELETSLHPHVAELIVKLFNDPLINKNNAQLIFTTHSLSLMSPHTMRKDQLNIINKSNGCGSVMTSLEAFESTLKDSSPFSKWYDEGRFGGVPSIDYREISDAIRGLF